MSGAYICQPLKGDWTAHDDERGADAAQVALGDKATAVVWWCSVVEGRETHEDAPVPASGVVERVLGHLGVRMGLEGEIA